MRFSVSRWTIPLAVALVAVGVTGLPGAERSHALTALLGALLLAVAAGWYWTLDARAQPEPLAKTRVAGVALSGLVLTLLYLLLVAALGLPSGLARFLYAVCLGVAAIALVVALSVAIDLAQLTRLRAARYLATMLLVGVAFTLVATVARAHPGTEPMSFTDPALAQAALVLLAALLAYIAPTEWVFVLDTRQRLAVFVGWIVALMPLSGAMAVARLVPLEHQHLLVEFVRLAALLCIVYLVVVLARATLALPGARAYERKVRELDAIYDFNLTAGSAFNSQEMHSAVLDSMLAVSEPDVAVLVEPDADSSGCSCVLLRVDGSGKHVYRFNSRTPWLALAERFTDRRPVVVVDHRKAPPGVLVRIWEPESGSSVIVPVIPHEGAPRAVLIAGRFETYAFDQGEVRSLAGFANQVALAMDHARLLRDTVEAERRQRELEIAREFQMNLLPTEPPEVDGFDIAARSEPATEVGGDYYDYLTLRNGNLGIVVGDVAGHGMRAGMLMAMAKSAIYTHGQSDESPTVLMERLNETLLHMSADNQFMTMVFCELDQGNRSYRYSNAGHHYPLHIRHGSGTVEELESNGLPLGMLPRAPGPFIERDLNPGDVLVFYSDGVVEAGESAGEMFGVGRLGEVVLANRTRDAKTVVEAVFRAVRRYSGDEPLADDATIVVLRALQDQPLMEANDAQTAHS